MLRGCKKSGRYLKILSSAQQISNIEAKIIVPPLFFLEILLGKVWYMSERIKC